MNRTNYPHLSAVAAEVVGERIHQDQRWGGIEHDDNHSLGSFADWVQGRTVDIFCSNDHTRKRRLFVEIAGLAIAAIQKLDRATGADTKKSPMVTFQAPQELIDKSDGMTIGFWSVGLYIDGEMLGTVYGDTDEECLTNATLVQTAFQLIGNDDAG